MEKPRNEIEEQYKWDLRTVYQNENELMNDFETTKAKIRKFKNHENIFLNSGENLYNCLQEENNIDMILEKMWVFTSHRYDTDITNNTNQTWKDKVYNLYEEFSKVSSFIIPKLLEKGYENIQKMIKDYPNLQEYNFAFEEVFRYEKHTLSENEEKLIANLGKAFSNTSEIAEMLSYSDIDFGEITDESGQKVKLTDTNYSNYIISKNRSVRQEAFKRLFTTYGKFNNTFALALAADIEKRVSFSKVKKFNTCLESALFSDNVPVKVYENLIDTVSNNLTPLFDYYELKRQMLSLDEIHLYDVYTPVTKEGNKKYSFPEAKKLVLESLKVLGEDYINILNKAFDERWIDIYPNKGKKGGAYSGGAYLTNPFVLLNYIGDYHDVSTLAHELGHSLHTYYSKENNPYQYSSYSIFVAEVASQVNELLLANYMLKHETSKEAKINILNQLLDLFKSSIYRQTMFAEFEKQINEEVEKGGILTADNLNNIYYNLVKKYFGDKVIADEEIKYEWQRIPHFYYNFYVYKYSTGLAAACYIVKNILTDKSAKEKYLSFLKTGGSMYPLEELKIAGVDLTDPNVIKVAMDMFREYLAEFKSLVS